MLHACDQRFDVTENLKNFCELNKSLVIVYTPPLNSCKSTRGVPFASTMEYGGDERFLRFVALATAHWQSQGGGSSLSMRAVPTFSVPWQSNAPALSARST